MSITLLLFSLEHSKKHHFSTICPIPRWWIFFTSSPRLFYYSMFAIVLCRGQRINARSESPSHGLFLTCRGENIFKHTVQKTCTQYFMHLWWFTKYNLKAILLGLVALCTRLQTSIHASLMLRINWPIFQPHSAPYMAPQYPLFSPTHPRMQPYTDNDDINIPDSSPWQDDNFLPPAHFKDGVISPTPSPWNS